MQDGAYKRLRPGWAWAERRATATVAGIVDELVALRRNPRILHGAWQVDVEYTDRTGAKVVAYLTRAQLAEWRARQ